MSTRKANLLMNPATSTAALWVLGGIGALGLGTWLYTKSKKTWTTTNIHDLPEGYLSGVFTPGATLAAAPMILSDIDFGVQPFYLSEQNTGGLIGLRDADGQIQYLKEARFANLDDLKSLVTNINGEMAYPLYDYMILQLSQSSVKSSMEAAQGALAKYRSQIEWYSPQTFVGNSPEAIVFLGARVLAEIARQNLENKGIL